MIGVAAVPAQHDVVSEFFELFKTPWEWLVPGKRYRVVLNANLDADPPNADLALIYGSCEHPLDRRAGVSVQRTDVSVDVEWGDTVFPVYESVATFHGQGSTSLLSVDGHRADYSVTVGTTTVRRIGYNLFAEVSRLLSGGQSSSHALIPTLEWHIEVIRQCLDDAGIPYVEVPPRPCGAEFICCLTHDVDFFGIRRHLADRTLGGFALRATLGTLRDLLRGRRPLDEALRNWLAVLSLPLVMLGVKRDLWHPFRDYARADRGHKSTFFLVPFKRRAGISPAGTIDERRAVAYGVRDVRTELQELDARQIELGVHGIDAWRDVTAGREEKAELNAVSSQPRTGVRMHWLYFSDESPRHLEEVGFDYDSSYGFNDAIGFRAGTLQVFRLPGSEQLLELPLSIMDTAMFYPDRMGLEREQSRAQCSKIVGNARRFGGALVVNWHDRSLAPERQWQSSYASLLDEIEAADAWFAKGEEAVAWFRWRRSIRFGDDASTQQITIDAPALPPGLPSGRLVVHRTAVEETPFAGGRCSLPS